MQAEAKSRFREFQGNLFFKTLITLFTYATKVLPRWFMRFCSHFFCIFFIFFTIPNYRAVIANMKTVFPDERRLRAAYLAYRMFLKYAYYLIDMFYISHGGERIKKFKINYYGEEILYRALDSRKGIILLTLHMGNWEIGGFALAAKGIPPPTIAYFPDSQDIIEGRRNTLRGLSNAKYVELQKNGFSAIKLLRILQAGGIVAIQGDRLQYDSGIEMDMFGRRALFPKGPIMLASASDSVILPTFMVMEGYNTYNIYVEKPIKIKVYSTRQDMLRENLRELIPIFEKYIRTYPDQWYTFMPFWLRDGGNSGQ